jgi:hypothetical protein
MAKGTANKPAPQELLGPDSALKRLERLVGTWDIKGRTLDSDMDNISGRMTCEWILGGFFLKQSGEIRFKGFKMQSLELIGYDPASRTFPASVYSDMSGVVLPYHWDVQGDTVKHWTDTHKYTGTFSDDGRTLTGGWRPIDGKGDVAYDAVMTRVDQNPFLAMILY